MKLPGCVSRVLYRHLTDQMTLMVLLVGLEILTATVQLHCGLPRAFYLRATPEEAQVY